MCFRNSYFDESMYGLNKTCKSRLSDRHVCQESTYLTSQGITLTRSSYVKTIHKNYICSLIIVGIYYVYLQNNYNCC